ncbi:MAG: MFS transporter [Candidatus Bathyarchaeota archaeon]|nr:MFS transporter [Candidatus Bathyarchaeota archaeon]
MSGGLDALRALHRDAKILVFTRALRSFSAAILNVSFSIYLSKLGASSIHIGLIFTGISLFSAFRSLLEGLVADRFGRKPILLYTAGLMVAGGTVFALARSLPVLMVAAVVFNVGGRLVYTPAEQAMLTEKVSSEERTTAFSVNAFLGTIAAVFGSLAAGLPELLQGMGVPEIASYRPIFIIFAAAGAVTLGFFTLVEETMGGGGSAEEMEAVEEAGGDERMLLMKWSGVVAVDIVGGSFITNLMSYWFYIRFGVGPGKIGAMFGASQLLAALSLILGLKMARRVGTIRATVLSRIPVVAVNVLTPLMPSFTAAALLRVFMSLFSMIDVPLRQSYLMGVIRSRRRASAAGVVTVVSRVTSAGAPSVTGYLFEYVSTALPFFVASSFQLASASLMYLLFKDIKPPEEDT